MLKLKETSPLRVPEMPARSPLLKMPAVATSLPEKPATKKKLYPLRKRLGTLSPHSFVQSKANDIRNSPWLSKEEFAVLYMWLYSNKTELMSKGVARVAALSTRGNLPIGIDITAHLCEAFLMEMKYNAGNYYQAVSFGFSVAITR